jgi:hypothetical protein
MTEAQLQLAEVELVDVSADDVQLVALDGSAGVGESQVPDLSAIAERYLAAEADRIYGPHMSAMPERAGAALSAIVTGRRQSLGESMHVILAEADRRMCFAGRNERLCNANVQLRTAQAKPCPATCPERLGLLTDGWRRATPPVLIGEGRKRKLAAHAPVGGPGWGASTLAMFAGTQCCPASSGSSPTTRGVTG